MTDQPSVDRLAGRFRNWFSNIANDYAKNQFLQNKKKGGLMIVPKTPVLHYLQGGNYKDLLHKSMGGVVLKKKKI